MDEKIKDTILQFIQTEAIRVEYGKLYIELDVVDRDVIAAECTPKKRIHLKLRVVK